MRQGRGRWFSSNQSTSEVITGAVQKVPAGFHLALDFFDFDEMGRIERKRRIVAVTFVRAEAAVGDLFTPAIHCGRIPELRKVPIVLAQIGDGAQDLATGNGAFIIDYGAGGSRPALKLRAAFQRGLHDQAVHVDVNSRFEESSVTAVVILDRGAT